MLTLRFSLLLLFLSHGKGNPDLTYQHGAGPFFAQSVLEVHFVHTYPSQVFTNL